MSTTDVTYNFTGKVAFITGTASGMGLATARSFAEAGAAVALVEKLVRDAGCAPVTTGDLASGRIFEWGNPGCFVSTNEAGLRRAMGM